MAGHNVVPGEVEASLFEHPAVTEAAVAGVAHPVLGEDVAAWVVLRRPASTRRAALVPSGPTGRLQGAAPDYRGRTRSRGTRAARSSSPDLVAGDEPRSAP